MNLHFAIPAWAACGPGLSTPAAWRAWASAPAVPVGEVQAPLGAVPPMVRRRLDALGRVALQAAFDVAPSARVPAPANADAVTPAAEIPAVFASRYGDAARGLDLLADLVRGDALSPTSFGLSVHNAIAAMYGIVRGDRSNQLAVAAGPDSAPAALVEPPGLLADGAPEVLVVYCEAPLPADYAPFEDGPSALHAWAWRVTAPVPGQPRFALSLDDGPAPAPADVPLPAGLDLLRVVASDAPVAARGRGPLSWTWRRHDA